MSTLMRKAWKQVEQGFSDLLPDGLEFKFKQPASYESHLETVLSNTDRARLDRCREMGYGYALTGERFICLCATTGDHCGQRCLQGIEYDDH